VKPFREILERFRRETEPSDDSLDRVRDRVHQQLSDEQIAKAVLGHLPAPLPGAEARVRARLASPRPASRRTWAYGVALAAAAAGFGLLLLPDPGLAPVQARLDAVAAPVELQPSPEVALVYAGSGRIEGTRRAPHIQWESGTVHVDVEPEQGIELEVHTAEATVQVVGTAFAVIRDPLGTRVEVEHGRVRVDCRAGGGEALGAGDSTTCLPTTAHGMLARARELQDRGASPELLLDTATVALERHPEPSLVRSELQLVRIEALTLLGREAEALVLAEDYLGAGSELRRDSVLALAARLAWSTGGCDAAGPWLEQLADVQPSVPNLVKLAECSMATRPELAQAALEQARALGPGPHWAGLIEQMLR
jgi:hypothetical protein